MNKAFAFYIKPLLVVAGFFYACCCLASGSFYSAKQYFRFLPIVVFATFALYYCYNKLLWRFCPWERVPRFYNSYKGKLKFFYNGPGEKDIEIQVEQTLFSVCIKLTTNEITSNSKTSAIVEENNCWMLYYTYVTNPKASYADNNPIQRGTACLIIERPKPEKKNLITFIFNNCFRVKQLAGTYWTSRKTTGDLEFWREEET